MTPPRVGVAGCGAISALGAGVAPISSALRANATGLRHCPRLAGKGYQSTVVGCVPDEVSNGLREADSAHRDATAFLLANAASIEALTECAQLFRTVPPHRRGLVLSTTKAEITALERNYLNEPCSALAQRHLTPANLAADLAVAHDVTGPVQCVSAACISGLLAIQQSVVLIQDDKADAALVVGVDLLSHFVLSGFTTLKSMELDGCRPFDADRKGLSLGEGAGALVLARREAIKGPAMIVSGWGSSNDANHLTGPSRDGSGLALAMNRALAKAEVTPDAIDFVHAHGTGTPFNDAMEALALCSVFGDNVPPFCSSKGLFGHTLGAAGILETLLCLTAARMQWLPGTPGLQQPDPSMPGSLLIAPRPQASLRRIVKTNAGFGGTNAALVLEWEAS